MDRHEREALDRHITGNYGEDQFRDGEGMDRDEALEMLDGLIDWFAAKPYPDTFVTVHQLYQIRTVLSSPCACRDESLAEGELINEFFQSYLLLTWEDGCETKLRLGGPIRCDLSDRFRVIVLGGKP